jgi:hypothetical protein
VTDVRFAVFCASNFFFNARCRDFMLSRTVYLVSNMDRYTLDGTYASEWLDGPRTRVH